MTSSVTAEAMAFADAIRPPELLPMDVYADRYHVLPAGSAAGRRWSTERTPYIREILRRLSPDDPCQEIVMMFASQMSKSEAALVFLGHSISHDPGHVMLVQPTVDDAKKFSKRRVAKLIDGSPTLRDLVGPTKSRDSDNTQLFKSWPGGSLTMVGANAPSGLASVPIQKLILDEVDRYPSSAGEEGDPVSLAKQRTATFGSRRKIVAPSTPTIAGESRIEAWYLEGDQREFWVPHLGCGAYQRLKFENMRWEKGHPETVHMVCIECGERIEEHEKAAMLAEGEWRAGAPYNGKTRSYHISALYAAPGLGWTWREIVEKFLEAKGDPALLQTVVNLLFGETWKRPEGETIDAGSLLDRREGTEVTDGYYRPGRRIPDRCLVVTVAADTQADRIEAEVVGWGDGEESWSLDYVTIPGNTESLSDPCWEALWRVVARRWVRTDGVVLRASIGGIDCGGTGTTTDTVLEWVRSVHGRDGIPCFALKGGPAGPRAIWPNKATVAESGKGRMFVIGQDNAKLRLFARLPHETTSAGYCHFPKVYPSGREADRAHFDQLVSEERHETKTRGQTTYRWRKRRGQVRNEVLDVRVYNIALLEALKRQGLDWKAVAMHVLDSRVKSSDDAPAGRRTETLPRRPAWVDRKRGWLR